jgi:hypothetical protein
MENARKKSKMKGNFLFNPLKICPICKEQFKYRANIDKHMRKVHNEKIYGNKKK